MAEIWLMQTEWDNLMMELEEKLCAPSDVAHSCWEGCYYSATHAVQEQRQTPIQFLVWVMDLRQQILFASERLKSGLKYRSEVIQNQSLQTFLTALHDNTIHADVKPIYVLDK